MVTMLSLFDGSGGFPLAGALCGITPKYASEVEPYPIAVTRSRFPDMIHLGDVSKVHGWDIDPVDVVTFGSPCQDMSIAGKRAGIKNENVGDEETTRSGLFHEAVRIIREMREATNGVYPAFAVWENVPGAFSSNKGEDFRCVLETLIQIVEPGAVMPTVPKGGWPYFDYYCGDGWSLAYRTFDAQYWGVPQRRRRIYLVLDLTGQRAGEILFKRPGLRGHFETSGAPCQGTSANVPGGTKVCDRPITYTLKIRSGCEGGGKGSLIQENMSATLTTNNNQCLFVPVVSDGFKAGQRVQNRRIGWQEERSPTFIGSNRGTQVAPTVYVGYDARGNGDGKTAITITGDHENRIGDYTTVVARMRGFGDYEKDEIASTLKARDFKDCTDLVVQGMDCRNGKLNGDLCGTLQAKPNDGFSPNCTHPVLIKEQAHYIVRRLTPIECAKLQGFPGRWGEIDPLDISDKQEVDRWRYIYKTYCIINGIKVSASVLSKPERLKKWHDKLHTDSAEYKMWGNGIALPNALYVMQEIAEALNNG